MIFDLEGKGTEVWFDAEGGGRICLRALSPEEIRDIEKQVSKKKVDYKRIDGTPARLEYQEIDEDKRNELFWDKTIVNWENFLDKKRNPIPCTTEMKMKLIGLSTKFVTFLNICLEQLRNDTVKAAEEAEKN